MAAERVYCPWPDMADAMRAAGAAAVHARVVAPGARGGPARDHAAGRADLLERARGARPGGHPAARVPTAPRTTRSCRGRPERVATPRRSAPFFDAFFMGESERAFEAVLDVIAAVPGRAARLAALAENPYLYLPGRRPPPGRAGDVCRLRRSRRTRWRSVVPYSSAIFSRASVEVMRGCTRGCRFCHAGTWYRPVRERPPDEVVAAGLAQLALHGLRRALADVACHQRLHRHRARDREDQGSGADAAPVASVQPRRHGAGGADRGGERPPELDHAGARGGHPADARHHLQDDHRRDDRGRRSRPPSGPATPA